MGQEAKKEFVPSQPETLFALTPNGIEDAIKWLNEHNLTFKGNLSDMIDYCNKKWRESKGLE